MGDWEIWKTNLTFWKKGTFSKVKYYSFKPRISNDRKCVIISFCKYVRNFAHSWLAQPKKGPFINFGQSYLLLLLPQHLTGDCSVIPLAVVLRFWGGGWFLGNVCKNVLDEDCGTDEEWCNSIPWCCCCWKIIKKIRNLFRKFKTC